MKKITLAFFGVCCLLFGQVFGQDGSADSSFGNNGVVSIDYGNVTIENGGIAQLSDGSYMVIARKLENNENSILIHKFLNDGSLDSTFGNNGVLEYSTEPSGENPQALYTVEDDKLLYSFRTNDVAAFKRYLPDGSIDTSFGANGELEPFPDELSYLIQLRLNKFNSIVAGLNLGTAFRIKRYLLTGEPDTSFGGNGTVTIQAPSSITSYQNFNITSDDKVLVTAMQEIDGEELPVIFRANQDGTIDPTFGNNGFVKIPYVDPNDEFAFNSNYAELFDDGAILIISIYSYPLADFALTRIYKMSSEGVVITAVGSGGEIVEGGLPRVIIQANQRILVTYQPIGMVGTGGRVGINRYYSDGFSDSSFSFDRAAFPILTKSDFLVDSDGKVVVAGGGQAARDLFVYRLNNNPLGIQENTQNNFTISPNPTNDFVTISCTECSLINKRYQITDATGKYIRQGSFSVENPTISMEGFVTGLYYLTIENTAIKVLKQ